MDKLICVGKIVAAKGIKGLMKVKSYTGDPKTLAHFNTLRTKTGFAMNAVRIHEEGASLLVISCRDIVDRSQAERLSGQELFIDRAELPLTQDEEYYHVDLIGLKVVDSQARLVGHVAQVSHAAGGDFLEISMSDGSGTGTIPFTVCDILTVNIQEGWIEVNEGSILVARPGSKEADDKQGALIR